MVSNITLLRVLPLLIVDQYVAYIPTYLGKKTSRSNMSWESGGSLSTVDLKPAGMRYTLLRLSGYLPTCLSANPGKVGILKTTGSLKVAALCA